MWILTIAFRRTIFAAPESGAQIDARVARRAHSPKHRASTYPNLGKSPFARSVLISRPRRLVSRCPTPTLLRDKQISTTQTLERRLSPLMRNRVSKRVIRSRLRSRMFYCIFLALLSVRVCHQTVSLLAHDLLRDGKVSRLLPRLVREVRRRYGVNWSGKRARALASPLFELPPQLPPVQVIVLQRSRNLHRSDWLLKQLEKQRVRYRIVDAIDGLSSFKDVDLSEYAGPRRKTIFSTSRPSLWTRQVTSEALQHERLRFGCYLTHVHLWKSLQTSFELFAIVLEDDVDIIPEFESSLSRIMADLPNDWDLLYLNGTEAKLGFGVRDELYQLQGSLGTFAYAISIAGARTLLMKAQNSDRPIDHLINDAISSGQILAFSPATPFVRHRDDVTSTLAYD